MATRWAICGTGRIASDFCTCLKTFSKSEHQIVAVASRQKAKAASFAAQYNIPQVYGSYQDLASVPNVDIVYIATLHINHVENSLMYISAGKGVLCEKPMSMSLAGCKKVLAAAREKGVLFVEAYWSRFFPAYKFIREHIQSGSIGDVKLVEATFATHIIDAERTRDPQLGGSGLMDVGCYTVQAANFIFQDKPDKVVAEGWKADSGVDKTGLILLKYSGDRFASLTYSTHASPGASSMVIRGSQGNIMIPDLFWCPDKVVLEDNHVDAFPLPESQAKFHCVRAQGLVYEAEAVRQCLLKGEIESSDMSHQDSETIMDILEQVQDQLSIKHSFL